MVDAGRELVAVFAREDLDVDDLALLAVRNFQTRVANFARLFAEDCAQEPFLGGQLGFALGRNLADEDVLGAHFGADANDAALVEILERVLTDVGNVARDLFGPQLRIARFAFVLLDVNRGKAILFDHAFADQDGVFVVIAFPRHECHEHVLAQSQLALIRRRTVDEHLTGLDVVADRHDRALVDARSGIAAHELEQIVGLIDALGVSHGNAFGIHRRNGAGFIGNQQAPRVFGGAILHAGADDRRVGAQQRNGLTLHVRTHQRAVGVVVFEERNQRRRNRDDLLGRNVHELNAPSRLFDILLGIAADDRVGGDLSARRVDRRVGLRDDVFVFAIGGEIDDLVADDSLAHDAIGRLDEAEPVDAPVGRQRTDQSDVRAFRRFDRTDAAVVRVVDVAHFEACAFAREAARAECRQAPLVRQLRQRVGLVHEL